MEARICDNRIVLPIGTAIGFKMIAKNEQKLNLNLTESEDNTKFYALFDENDVDFEIEINNSKCIHGIGYTLIVNNGFYDYYIGPREVWSMEALYTRGRKLHFISENSEEGQNVIQKTANDYDISYSESAAVCSRIEFNFEVEKSIPKNLQHPIDTVDTQAFVESDSLSYGSSAQRSPSLLGCFSMGQSLSRSSTPVKMSADAVPTKRSSKKIKPQIAYNVALSASPTNQSTHLDRMAQQSHNRSQPIPKLHSLSLAEPLVDVKAQDDDEREKSGPDHDQVGDRGVVCFGEESSQLYNPYAGFTKDNDLAIKPFVVELRFSKK